MKILTRYVLVEVAKTFLLAFTVLTGVFMVIGSFQALHRFNLLEFGFLLRILPALFAGTVTLTLPFSLLVAATLTLGRLAADNEVTALKACGVHLGRVISPLFAVGLGLSGVTYYLNDVVVPRSYVDRDEILTDAIRSLLQSKLTAGATTIDYFEGYRVTYSGIQEGKFQNVVIHRLDGVRISEEIVAEEAEVEYDDESRRIRFRLTRGSIAQMTKDPRRPDEPPAFFELGELDIEIPLERKRSGQARPRSLTHREILDLIPVRERAMAEKGRELAEVEAEIARQGASENLENRAKQARRDLEEQTAWRDELQTAFHLRIASSCLSFFIVLVGAPLGILVRHSNRLVAFFVSTLPVGSLYLPLYVLGKKMGDRGELPALPAVWMANAALAALGLVLLYKTLRR